jgi:hypothetical protein
MKAIVRVSFQSQPLLNRHAQKALTGAFQLPRAGGAFDKVATATYVNVEDDPQRVLTAVAEVLELAKNNPEGLDFLSITIVKPDAAEE